MLMDLFFREFDGRQGWVGARFYDTPGLRK